MAVLLGNSIPLYYPGKHDPQIHHQRNNSLTVWQSQPSQMAGKVEIIFPYEMNCDIDNENIIKNEGKGSLL